MNENEIKRQAIRVWAIVTASTLAWLALIVAPAVLNYFHFPNASGPIYAFFGAICHQIPERTFHIDGHALGVCSRCFGVYFGLVAGLLIYPLWRRIDDIEPLPRKWLILSIVPMAIDWSLTVFDIWENTFATRFITGLILGVGCATYIVPAVVEIVRNFSGHKKL